MITAAVCPKCLKNGESEAEYRERLAKYLTSLPAEIKTPNDEYHRRLGICSICHELENGVCRTCGCYPEMRAAKAAHVCPSDFW